jgi:uncharacterized protein
MKRGFLYHCGKKKSTQIFIADLFDSNTSVNLGLRSVCHFFARWTFPSAIIYNEPMNTLQAPIRKVLSRHEQIKLCIIFGSIASGKESGDSDLDLAIAGDQPLSATELLELAEEFSTAANRNVDLVDLVAATGLISQQALSTGVIFQNNDKDLYARLISRMLFNQADMMPYHDRILRERRRQFLNE